MTRFKRSNARGWFTTKESAMLNPAITKHWSLCAPGYWIEEYPLKSISNIFFEKLSIRLVEDKKACIFATPNRYISIENWKAP